MIVRFLKATPYTPAATDSPRCWGQLHLRSLVATRDVTVQVAKADGTTETLTTTQTSCGPTEHFFPEGAMPDLTPAVAEAFIAAGHAELVDAKVQFVTKEEIEQMVFGNRS